MYPTYPLGTILTLLLLALAFYALLYVTIFRRTPSPPRVPKCHECGSADVTEKVVESYTTLAQYHHEVTQQNCSACGNNKKYDLKTDLGY